ncbi:MAG: hypothetical protein K5885_08565 [Bacteroidales bacterium]|nr:hypothetical protein [Bacteroidales bacterium]
MSENESAKVIFFWAIDKGQQATEIEKKNYFCSGLGFAAFLPRKGRQE